MIHRNDVVRDEQLASALEQAKREGMDCKSARVVFTGPVGSTRSKWSLESGGSVDVRPDMLEVIDICESPIRTQVQQVGLTGALPMVPAEAVPGRVPSSDARGMQDHGVEIIDLCSPERGAAVQPLFTKEEQQPRIAVCHYASSPASWNAS